MNFKKALTLTSLALLALPAVASAQPQIDPETDQGLPFYAVVGKEITVSHYVSDTAVCSDDRYDENTDEYIDPRGDDYGMVGMVATLQSQPQTAGGWTDITSKTVTRDDIDVSCEEGEGQASVEMELAGKAADVRTNYRIVYRGGAVNANLESKPNLMFPRFNENWQWRTAKNVKSTQLKLTTDARLIGAKFVFLLSTDAGFKSFKVTKKATIGKKGGKGFVSIKQKLPASAKKRGWRGYGCINYQQKYPLMNTGNSCPTTTTSAARLEELFPYSTQGGL